MPIASPARNDRILATIVVLSWAALFDAADALPLGRLWAINHLAFLPSIAAWFHAGLTAASLVAIWTVRDSSGTLSRIRRTSLISWLPVILLGWTALSVVVSAATPLLGDGYLRIDEAERRAPGLLLLTEILPGIITTNFQQKIGADIGLTGRDTIAGFSVLSGVLFVVGSLLLWPRAATGDTQTSLRRRPSTLGAFWLLSTGPVMMFLGYYETYALAAVSLTLFSLAVIAHVNHRLGWGWPLAFWVLSFSSHLLAIGWAPVLIWSLVRGTSDARQRKTRLITAIAVVVDAVILLAQVRESGTPFLWHRYLLPLWSTDYAILDWRHAADLLNHLLLMAPALLTLLLPAGKAGRTAFPRHIIWLSAPSIAFCLVFAADLGWARDWDLYALASMPAIVAAVVHFSRIQESWPLPRRIAAATVAVSALSLWVWVNADESASVRRFQSLLQLDSHLGTAGNETMARYWRESGRWDLAVEELGRGLAKEPHARLAVQRGYAWGMLGQYDSALVAFRSAIEYDPGMVEGYLGAGQSLNVRGSPDSAQVYLEQAITMDSTRADIRYQLGMSLISQGDFISALPHVAWVAARKPDEPMFVNTWATALGETGQLDSAATLLDSLTTRFPEFALAHASLAWVRWRLADTAATDQALRAYERLVPVAQRVGPAIHLRLALDSVSAAM